jgi:hypothetical protein
MFQRNQVVEAYYDDGWYPGIVHKINDDMTYVVHFDDGDILEDMRVDEIRLPAKKGQEEIEVEGGDSFENAFDDEISKGMFYISTMFCHLPTSYIRTGQIARATYTTHSR